jgi:hypothetical protein
MFLAAKVPASHQDTYDSHSISHCNSVVESHCRHPMDTLPHNQADLLSCPPDNAIYNREAWGFHLLDKKQRTFRDQMAPAIHRSRYQLE